jgi:hypothetical protein
MVEFLVVLVVELATLFAVELLVEFVDAVEFLVLLVDVEFEVVVLVLVVFWTGLTGDDLPTRFMRAVMELEQI